ncbi:hypothetical protein AAFF_G00010190 [Aldrovandia affinis]|uniref:ribonuclease H n=1 Tax=Aldrovandia affinis TaxID=143900 RepID=A0AAD7S706_9TELE|nr:hypothetical protein AAFF_G00010190 [Aldrovandia affinis]
MPYRSDCATVEKILQLVPTSTWVVYLDDILVHAATALNNLRLVFQQIAKANLHLNPAKCSLFRCQTSFLGHVISEKGISTDLANTEPRARILNPGRSFHSDKYRKGVFENRKLKRGELNLHRFFRGIIFIGYKRKICDLCQASNVKQDIQTYGDRRREYFHT